MPEITISQQDADILIAKEKERVSDDPYLFPEQGKIISIPIRSKDRSESFMIDISRGSLRISKITYQERARNVIPLIRLDIDGSPHTNPDGTYMEGDHIHIYREGFGDKWAHPVPKDFSDISNMKTTCFEFFDYCNIVSPPIFLWGLFA